MIKLQRIFFTLFIFSFALLPFLWLRGNNLILGYDAVYPLEPVAFLRDRIFSWSAGQNLGLDQSGIQGSLIIHFFDVIPRFFGFSIPLTQKLNLSFWFFMMLFAAYFLVVKLEQEKLIQAKWLRYFFPVLYAINFYILQAWWIIERTKFSLVVATPLIMAVLLPLLFKKLTGHLIIKKSIICASILFLFNGGGWSGLTLYGGLLIVLATYYLLFTFICLIQKKYRELILFNFFWLLFIFWVLTFNAYTLLPFFLTTLKDLNSFLTSAGGINSQIAWARYLSQDTSFINLFRLQGIPDLYNNSPGHPYADFYLKNPVLIFGSFVFPLLLALSLVRQKFHEKMIVLYFFFLFLIAIIFTAGMHAPLGFIFEFFMVKIPGFFIFRSPIFKFGYAFWLAASFLIALGLNDVAQFLTRKLQRIVKASGEITIGSLLIVGLALYHFPIFTGDIFRISKEPIGTRVSVPSYVGEFASWWKANGKLSKVMLLPKLNDNWLFEQYTWKYLSLFPILGNYGTRGIVENLDNLSPSEGRLIAALYQAIDNKNYPNMALLSKYLGIDYFLVRHDFFYNLSDGRETSDPRLAKESLEQNPEITFVRSFGLWDLYRHKQLNNSLFYLAQETGILSGETGKSLSDVSSLPYSVYLEAKLETNLADRNIKSIVIFPTCLTCRIEEDVFSVQLPTPRILPDSPFYPLIELRNNLHPGRTTGEAHLFSLVGSSLKLLADVNLLIQQNKFDYVVPTGRRYLAVIEEIAKITNDLLPKTENPYLLINRLESYFEVERDQLANYVFSIRRDELQTIYKAWYEINLLLDKLNDIFSKKDRHLKKIFKFNVSNRGFYKLQINQESLNISADYTLAKIKFLLDEQPVELDADIYLTDGQHILTILLPEIKNLLEQPRQETINRLSCVVSYFKHYTAGKRYKLTFSIRDVSADRLFFFVDRGDLTMPLASKILLQTGSQQSFEEFMVYDYKKEGPGPLRVAFCGSDFGQKNYEYSVENLRLVEPREPLIFLMKKIAVSNQPEDLPNISVSQIDPTKYRLRINNVADPFYLVFNQRFSNGWKAYLNHNSEPQPENTHSVGNSYNNVWFISKTGDFDITVKYVPQDYFPTGLVISLISGILAGVIFFKL